MFKIQDAISVIERFAPPDTAEEYDNPGLLCGSPADALTGVTVALDLNPAVVEEAKENGSDLIVTHHPAIFAPIYSVDTSRPELKALAECVKHGIAVYAAHTNVDKAEGGLTDRVLSILGAKPETEGATLPKIGVFPEPVTLAELCSRAAERLSDARAAYVGRGDKRIRRAALITGAGGDMESLHMAKELGADVFLSGEFKYHVIRFAKDADYAIIALGHYESEMPFAGLVAGWLRESGIPGVFEAASLENPYNTEGRP